MAFPPLAANPTGRGLGRRRDGADWVRAGGAQEDGKRVSGFNAARRQPGGGNASASGTTGSGAHSIVVISARGSRLRWRAVRTTLASTC